MTKALKGVLLSVDKSDWLGSFKLVGWLVGSFFWLTKLLCIYTSGKVVEESECLVKP